MKSLANLPWLFVAVCCLCFGLALAPNRVLAQAPSNAPMPLPDILIYGTVTRDGHKLEHGVVKAVLPRGGVVTAAISPVSGTDFGYVLAIPLSQYQAGAGEYASGSVRRGEAINFQIDDVPAAFLDADSKPTSLFVVPDDAIGNTYTVDLFLSGPDAFPIGDVNVSGRADANDALLVLKYDLDLIPGVTQFPPGPRTVYLPLCDMVEDGVCDSIDAMRILQCDAGVPGVPCPLHPTAAAKADQPVEAAGAGLAFHLQIEKHLSTNRITMRALADSASQSFGVVTMGLAFDPSGMIPESCDANPDNSIDLGACNLVASSDRVRFNALSLTGVVTDTSLVEVTFKTSDMEQDVTKIVSMTVENAVAPLGNDVDTQIEDPEVIIVPHEPVSGGGLKLYLPALQQASAASGAARGDAGQVCYLPYLFRAPGSGGLTEPVGENRPEDRDFYLPLLFYGQTTGAAGQSEPPWTENPPEPGLYLPHISN